MQHTENQPRPIVEQIPQALRKLDSRVAAIESQNSRGIVGIAISALLFSIAAAVGVTLLVLFPPGGLPGSSLDNYDFSTPSSAVISELEMGVNGDLRAAIEFNRLTGLTLQKAKLDTIQFHKEVEHAGHKGLFVSYEENGVPKYEVVWMEKDANTGLWMQGYVNTYGMDDASLKALIERWNESGSLQKE